MLAITTGIVTAYLTDYALTDIKGWRYMFGLGAIPAIGRAPKSRGSARISLITLFECRVDSRFDGMKLGSLVNFIRTHG